VLATPGFVEDIAAGDVIRVLDESTGRFEIVQRGGNIGLQIFSSDPIGAAASWLRPRIEALGGWWDGQIERAVVFTVPVARGFDAIEKVMEELCLQFPKTEWQYSNVDDQNGQPLNWWIRLS